jgi:hypothetical protein
MKEENPVWQVILGLSRYPVFLNHRTHRTHGNKTFLRYVMLPCTRVCSVVPCSMATRANTWVAAPQYRAAANTAMGWKNANLQRFGVVF